MTRSRKPLIGITIGDPAGIGPEVVVKALDEGSIFDVARPVVIGDAGVLACTVEMLEARLRIQRIAWPSDDTGGRGVLELVDLQNVNLGALRTGQVQAAAGGAAFEFVRRATEMALAGAVDAVATAPINKEALRQAGVPYLDHTAMFAGLTGSPDPLTMFAVGRLKIFFATRHVSLRRACDDLSAKLVYDTIVKAHAALCRFGWLESRIAVAALNPHGGEGGMFGDEEATVLQPAVQRAQQAGINAFGPIPADTVFHLCRRGDYDAVLSLYHDQGHIAAKTLDFERTVSITTGLPFVRSSVDHGTAFDIAGKGLASGASMAEAIKAAAEYTRRLRGEQLSMGE